MKIHTGRMMLRLTAVLMATLWAGCQSTMMQPSGFLSNYSQLTKVNNSTWRYVDARQLAACNAFTIAPIEVLVNEYSGTALTAGQKQQAAARFRAILVKTFAGRYPVVDAPTANSGEIRAAITAAYRVGNSLGLGLEGEILTAPSRSRAAAVRTFQVGPPEMGGPILADTFNVSFLWWDRPDAGMIMEQWAKRLLEAIEKAHQP